MTDQPRDHGDSAETAQAASTQPSRRRPADTFAVRLILSRHLNGMTIGEAAQVSGINDATWSTWEAGRRPRDILDAARRIAAALDVDHEWLLFGGPLAGAHGVPTKRPGADYGSYAPMAVRMTPNDPIGLPHSGYVNPATRRPARIAYTAAT